MSRIITVLFALFLILVLISGVLLYIRNTQTVMLDFYFASLEMNLALTLAIAVLGGALLGVAVSLIVIIRLKYENKRYARSLSRVEENRVIEPSLPDIRSDAG